MIKLKKHIEINAPVEAVFSFMNKPKNLLDVWPSMVKVENVEQRPSGGSDYDWTYKMAGVPFTGRSVTAEFVENERSVIVNEGGIPSKFIWEYHQSNGGTAVDLEVEYTVPMPVLGKLAEKVVVKINENEAATLLSNLKAVMEA